MKLGFEIVCLEKGEGGTLYSVRFEGEETTELEKFLENPEVRSCQEYEGLVARLNDMVDERGFKKQFFKEREGSRLDSVVALHYDNKRLRLYCLRWSNVLLVAGYGGIKTTRTYQENPVLQGAVQRLQYVDDQLTKRKRLGDIEINQESGEMTGNLIFNKEDIL
ncbi:MAG: hypothetical protein HGB11_10515 [Chlorobiales bacterium]|nr:hypothetical protein [Chlorobiales bacterium]